MDGLVSFIESNADWLFGSTSVAALVLGAAQLYFSRSSKKQSRSSKPASPLAVGTIAVLLVIAASSGYFVVTGGENVAQVEGGNVIQSGDGSTNIISNDSTVINSD